MFITMLAINSDNLLISLDILWKGMLGIFVVMALIYISIKLLNFFTNKERMAAFLDKLKKKIKPETDNSPAESPANDDSEAVDK